MYLPKMALTFLDTQLSLGPNNTLTTVYRKPTPTDQYLHWNNNHFIVAKHSVFNTVAHRAKVVSTTQQTLHKELEHIRKTLQACHFQPWTLNKLQQKFLTKTASTMEQCPGTTHPTTIPTIVEPTTRTSPLWSHTYRD